MRKFIFYFDKELTQADTAPYIQVILLPNQCLTLRKRLQLFQTNFYQTLN